MAEKQKLLQEQRDISNKIKSAHFSPQEVIPEERMLQEEYKGLTLRLDAADQKIKRLLSAYDDTLNNLLDESLAREELTQGIKPFTVKSADKQTYFDQSEIKTPNHPRD